MKPLGFTLAEMKDLLDSIGILDRADSSRAQRATAARYLHQCQAKVDESAEKLRKQLAYAEEMRELLAIRSAKAVGNPE